MITEGDRVNLLLANRDIGHYDKAVEWFLGTVPLPWQYATHHVRQRNVTILAGIAAGKTIGETQSTLIDCITNPYFKALNTSVTGKQAEIGFDYLMQIYESNERLRRQIYNIVLKPWPIIEFNNFSLYEFRTAGKNARFIRGKEYDRVNYDEAGLDQDGEAVKILRGRLRGRRPNGIRRMARMDVFTSPTDSVWLRERYERGIPGSDAYKPSLYKSLKITTYENINLSKEQIELMEEEYTEEMRRVEMDAEFPDYGGSMFPKRHIRACTSQEMYDEVYEALFPENGKVKQGYNLVEDNRAGIVKIEYPRTITGRYVLAGDPGVDDPPRNNAGVVIVFDLSVRPHRLVYFHWVAGHGDYDPWIESFKYAQNKYNPEISFLDTTGPQKLMRELAFTNHGLDTDPLNYQGLKDGMLNALHTSISNHKLVWPLIQGMDRQLSTYTRENDKNSWFPKDITMTMAMIAYAVFAQPSETPKNKKRGAFRSRRKRL